MSWKSNTYCWKPMILEVLPPRHLGFSCFERRLSGDRNFAQPQLAVDDEVPRVHTSDHLPLSLYSESVWGVKHIKASDKEDKKE